MSSIVDIINHYQASINKSLNDTARIVHCIGKLYKLPISVRHLQDTGIGRTVNSLRKYDGEVGIAAKALVTKWKAMVAAEDDGEDGTTNVGSHGEAGDSDGRQNGDRQQRRSDLSGDEEDDGGGGGGGGGGYDRSTMPEDDDDEDDEDESGGEEHDEHGDVSHGDRDESYEESQMRVEEEFRDGVAESHSDSDVDDDESDGQTGQEQVHHHHHQQEEHHPARLGEKTNPDQWSEHHSSSSSSKKHSSSSSSRHHHDGSESKPSSSSSDGRSKHSKTSSRHSSSTGDSKSHKTSSSSRSDHHGSSKRASSHGDGERHKDRSSSKHHSNDTSAGSSHNSSSARKNSSHKEGRHGSKDERSGSSKRQPPDEIDALSGAVPQSKRSRKEHRATEHGDPDGAVRPEPSSLPSTSHSKKDKLKESSSSSSSKHRDRSEKSKSSKDRSADESKSSKSRRKEKSASHGQEPDHANSEEDVNEGLDHSGGASFADALAMIGVPSGSKKKSSGGSKEKVKVTMTKPSPSSSSGGHASQSRMRQDPSSSYSPSTSSGTSGRSNGVPSASDLLSQKVKLDPLPDASEIADALPMISPHYRPMPLNQTVMECVFMGMQGGRGPNRPLTEEEALGQSMQSKNLRTKVYSGMKTNAKGVIPTLYELCIRLLQDHLDEIGATGGIPFYILKPVLERANPTQLLNLEHFNPHFVEDSDVLWEQHCKRTFRSKQRNEDELETWREMYLRCSEERDAKLKSLTQNIKLSQEQAAAPIRKTQLAYVDSAVKPPRNVISKQAKYGTARAPVVSPAARVAALKAGNVTQAGDARLRVAAGIRDNAQAQVFQPTKPRKAPMMAKVLSSMKGFKTSFRR